MKATLEFTLPDEQHEFMQASRAGEAFLALEEFGEYLRAQEKYVDPAERDDISAVRRQWYEIMDGLLDP